MIWHDGTRWSFTPAGLVWAELCLCERYWEKLCAAFGLDEDGCPLGALPN